MWVVWIIIALCLGTMWYLYENVEWIRKLLGHSRGQISFGFLVLVSPILLIAYLVSLWKQNR